MSLAALAVLAALGALAGAGDARAAAVAPAPRRPVMPRSAPLATATPQAPAVRGGGLADNGLRSPGCRRGAAGAGVSTIARDCEITGLAFVPAPIDHYNFDVYADQSLSIGGSITYVVQEVLLTPIWTALVWLVHAVAVALEWCFSIDLLDSATAGPIAAALRATQRAFTDPWMAAVLAVAGAAAAYRGLVQRRVADTLSEAATLLVMIALGLWMVADPRHTIGAVDAEVNAASLGAVAVFSSGSPQIAESKFERGLGGMFADTIQAPWCYLEFGDVAWCRDRSRLDQRLAAAAQRIIARGPLAVTCGRSGVSGLVQCGQAAGDPAEARREVALLREARTNGDMFLAFPGGAPLRNSVTTPGSLLTALCGAGDIATCQGATVAQAEFRTSSGTWPRAGGLLFIVVGTAGMLALFAFLALRLLGAALLTVFYLLLAPVAVLSPALGEGGRAAFRGWAARLAGALAAKLLYSVLLGAVLLMVRLLTGMSALGWWTEWLLVTAFWWLVFSHRHRLLELGSPRGRPQPRGQLAETLVAGRAITRFGTSPVRGGQRLRRRVSRVARRTGADRRPTKPALARPLPALRATDSAEQQLRSAQASRLLAGEHASALERSQGLLGAEPAGATLRERAGRLRDAQREAVRRGDSRRAVVAGVRASDLVAQAERLETAAENARERASRSGALQRATGMTHDREDHARADAWLDAQTRLRRGVSPGPRSPGEAYRDYPRLVALAGLTTAQYERLDPGAQRRARLAVDRELLRRGQSRESHALQRAPRSDAAARRRRQFLATSPRAADPTPRSADPIPRSDRGARAADRGPRAAADRGDGS